MEIWIIGIIIVMTALAWRVAKDIVALENRVKALEEENK